MRRSPGCRPSATRASSRSTASASTRAKPCAARTPSRPTLDECQRSTRRCLLARAGSHARRRRHPSARVPRRAPCGVPSIALGNFTWDWIYAAYPEELGRAPRAARPDPRSVRACGARLRLPLGGGFDAFSAGGAGAVHRPAVGACRRRSARAVRPAGGPARWCWRRSAGTGCATSTWVRSRALQPLHGRGDRERAGGTPRRRSSRCRRGQPATGASPTAGVGAVRRRARHLRRRVPLRRPRAGGGRRRNEAGLRDHRGVHRERHGAALHLTRTVRGVRRHGARDAALPALRVHLERGSVRGRMGARARRRARAARSARAAACGRRRGRGARMRRGAARVSP